MRTACLDPNDAVILFGISPILLCQSFRVRIYCHACNVNTAGLQVNNEEYKAFSESVHCIIIA